MIIVSCSSKPTVTRGVPASLCPEQVSLQRTAAVCLVKGGCEELGWLCGAATASVLQPGRAALCTRLIYTQWGKKEAKCFGHKIEGVRIIPFLLFLRITAARVFLQGGHCWYWWMVFRATCSIKASKGQHDHGYVVWTWVCVIEQEPLNGCVVS